jgi:hypothetical protein
MGIPTRYKLRSPTRVLFGEFPSVPSSSTTLRVVTTGIVRGSCPTPYPIRCRLCAQSRGPECDKPRALHSRVLQASEYF